MEDRKYVIELVGIKRTRPILSQIRHQVEKWIEREQSLMFLPALSDYRVILTHEEDPPAYTCQVQVWIGNRRWFGCDSAKTLQDAIELTLRHLKTDPCLGRAWKKAAPEMKPESVA